MRKVQDFTFQLLTGGGGDQRFTANLVYDSERVAADLQLVEPQLSWDASAQVVGGGEVTIVHTDPGGRSLAPTRPSDPLSPFGGELQISCVVTAGPFQERVQVGQFVIARVEEIVQDKRMIGGVERVVAERIRVSLRDPLIRPARDEFPFPASPTAASIWDEIQAVSRMQIVRNTDDQAVPAGVVYEEDHLAALVDLFAALDAWPYVRPDGVLTSRPKQPGPVVATLSTDTHITGMSDGMDPEGVYNQVAVEGKDPNGEPIRAIAKVTAGGLRVANIDGSQSPFGTVTTKRASDWMTTQAQVDAYALSTLDRVARYRTRHVELTLAGAWLYEIGDVLEVVSMEGTPQESRFVGRAVKVDLGAITLEVTDAL